MELGIIGRCGGGFADTILSALRFEFDGLAGKGAAKNGDAA